MILQRNTRSCLLAAGALNLVISGLAWPAIVVAQPAPQVQDEVILETGAVQGSSGRIAVNGAAGTGNQQLSSATIALGDIAISEQSVSQADSQAQGSDRSTHIHVSDGAFAGNSGLLSLNISAGNSNQSANLALLSVGNTGALSDQLLEQSRAATRPEGDTGGGAGVPNDRVDVGDDAFRDNSGLVQINLLGGERNSSANTLQLSITAGSTTLVQ